MRTLKFNVRGQILEKDDSCDFSNLVPGTDGYLIAEFTFSPEWNGHVKVAAFYSALGKEYPAQVLKDGKSCFIPEEALKRKTFKIQVVGKNSKTKITTNKVAISQNGGK